MLSHSTNDVDRIFLFLLIPIHFTDYIFVSVVHKFYSFLIILSVFQIKQSEIWEIQVFVCFSISSMSYKIPRIVQTLCSQGIALLQNPTKE